MRIAQKISWRKFEVRDWVWPSMMNAYGNIGVDSGSVNGRYPDHLGERWSFDPAWRIWSRLGCWRQWKKSNDSEVRTITQWHLPRPSWEAEYLSQARYVTPMAVEPNRHCRSFSWDLWQFLRVLSLSHVGASRSTVWRYWLHFVGDSLSNAYFIQTIVNWYYCTVTPSTFLFCLLICGPSDQELQVGIVATFFIQIYS